MKTQFDFSNVVLMPGEIKTLKRIRHEKRVPDSEDYSLLCSEGFLEQNLTDAADSFGFPVSDGTLSLSDKGRRFLKYRHDRTIDKFVTPVIVAAATTTVLYTLQHSLLPGVLSWALDLLRWIQACPR